MFQACSTRNSTVTTLKTNKIKDVSLFKIVENMHSRNVCTFVTFSNFRLMLTTRFQASYSSLEYLLFPISFVKFFVKFASLVPLLTQEHKPFLIKQQEKGESVKTQSCCKSIVTVIFAQEREIRKGSGFFPALKVVW